MFALSCALLSCGNEKNGDISQLPSPKVIRDCREMPKKVFDFPNELIDKVIEIS